MKFRLIRNSFQTLITVPRRIWDRFRAEKSISSGDAAKVSAIAGALVAALATGAPTVAYAEDANTDTATTSEMTYQMSDDELAELTSSNNSVVEETTPVVEAAPVVEQTTAEETAPAVEQTTAEETAPAVEQTAAEETAPAVEQTTAEETAPAVEQTAAEETAPAAEQTTAEETAPAVEQTATEKKESEKNIAPGKPTADYGTVTKEETKTIEESGSSYEVTETETTSRAAFTVVEKNGKVYVFTDAGEDALSQKMLSEQLEEWWTANYGANNTPTYVYSISSLGTGTKTIGEDGVVIKIDNDGKISVIDEDVTKTEELDENLETVETGQETKEETSKTETKEESKQESETETKKVEIADDDFIIITGKDGSITIGYKYILGAKGYEKILESLNLPKGTIINTPILLPTKPEEGISEKNSLTAGNLTITTEDGIHYVITGDGANEVKTSKDSTDLLKEAAEKSENGHLDGDKGKPNHDEPEPEPKPEPEPEPKPEPKPTPSILPKTGDDSKGGLAKAMAGLGITMLGMGLLSNKLKLSKGGAKYALVERNNQITKFMTKQLIRNESPVFSGRTI